MSTGLRREMPSVLSQPAGAGSPVPAILPTPRSLPKRPCPGQELAAWKRAVDLLVRDQWSLGLTPTLGSYIGSLSFGFPLCGIDILFSALEVDMKSKWGHELSTQALNN